MRLPSLTELAELDSEPRVHPNGFIQLDLDERLRLHVWHPRLPYRQKTYHPVHDHVFGFTSHVFSGRMVHTIYNLTPDLDGTHAIWRVQAIGGNEESVLSALEGGRVRLVHDHTEVTQPGGSYQFEAYRFHETLSNEPTLTIIEKVGAGLTTGVNSQGASVVVPIGVAPDNNFRRDAVNSDVLWELISEAHPCE